MKNLLILQPTPIVSVTASRGSGAANLLTPDPREVWMDSGTGTATLVLDFGQPRVINTIFLGHLLPPHVDATWSITGGLIDSTSLLISPVSSLRVPDVTWRSPALSHAFWTGAAVRVRYIRLSVTQPAGSAPLSAGVLIAGYALQPAWNHEWGSGRRPIDTNPAVALPDGGFSGVEGVRKSAWFWTLGDLADDELDALWEIALDRGESRPLLVVEDPDRTAGLRRRLHYGIFRQFREFERLTRNRTRWELRIEDWGADEAAPISSPPLPPAAPVITVYPRDRGLLVAWTDSANGGAPIEQHGIYVNGNLVATTSAASPYRITGLTNGVAASVEVTAINLAGPSPRSEAKSAVPVAPPVFVLQNYPSAFKPFQRATSIGGAAGKGAGTVVQPISVSAPGTVIARIVADDDNSVVLHGPVSINVTVLDAQIVLTDVAARLRWGKVQLSADWGETWQTGAARVGVGCGTLVCGQSLATRMFDRMPTFDNTTLAELVINPSPYGVVYATWYESYNDKTTGAAWEVPSDTGRYRSAWVAEFLRLQIQAEGVICFVVGHARGASLLEVFNPGGSENAALLAVITEAGGFERVRFFQGHQNYSSSATNYRAALTTFFSFAAANNGVRGANFAALLTTVPNIAANGTYNNNANLQGIRTIAAEWAYQNGAVYSDLRDLELYSDNVHPLQAAERRQARHDYRSWRPLAGLVGDNRGPRPISATRAAGSRDIVIMMQHRPGASNLDVRGNPGLRFGAFARRSLSNPLALDATTPFAVANNGNGTSTITLRLAAVPADTLAIDIYWDPYPSPKANGSVDMIYDDHTDLGEDGIAIGRPIDWPLRGITAYAPSVSAPANTALPTITGTARARQTQTGTIGSWSGADLWDVEYFLSDNGAALPDRSVFRTNATSLAGVVASTDVGHPIAIKVTGYGDGGATVAWSAPSPVVDSKRGPDLTATGSPTYVAGKFGQAIRFVSNAYLSATSTFDDVVPQSLTAPLGPIAWTVEAWISLGANPNANVVAFGQLNKLYVAINTAGGVFAFVKGQATDWTSGASAAITNGAFHHVAVVSYGAAGAALYVDGALVSSTTNAPRYTAGTGPFQVGALGGSLVFVNGAVEELAAWDSAIYAGSGFTPPVAPYAGTEIGLRALYHFDGNFVPAG